MAGICIAEKYLGLSERADKDKLMEFFKAHSINKDILVDPSTTAWCAAFANACERAAGFKGTGSNLARSFLNYGNNIKWIDAAQRGDILILKRGKVSWQGHVTYFNKIVKQDGEIFIECLGGNQGDKVCYALYPLSSLIGVRRSAN